MEERRIAVDPEELEKSILADKRNGGKLSKKSISLFWDMINLQLKKGNYRGYDEDTKADMAVLAFTLLSKYWKNYVPYQITIKLASVPPKKLVERTGVKIGAAGTASIKWKDGWKEKLGILRNEGYVRKISVRKFSVFSYYLQYIENAFKNVLNKRKSNPFNGFQYRTGENGNSINGHVVVGHRDKELKFSLKGGPAHDVADETATEEKDDGEYYSTADLDVSYLERKKTERFCGREYEIIYDRPEIMDMLAAASKTTEEMMEYAKILILHDPSSVKALKKDESFMYLALEYEKRSKN